MAGHPRLDVTGLDAERPEHRGQRRVASRRAAPGRGSGSARPGRHLGGEHVEGQLARTVHAGDGELRAEVHEQLVAAGGDAVDQIVDRLGARELVGTDLHQECEQEPQRVGGGDGTIVHRRAGRSSGRARSGRSSFAVAAAAPVPVSGSAVVRLGRLRLDGLRILVLRETSGRSASMLSTSTGGAPGRAGRASPWRGWRPSAASRGPPRSRARSPGHPRRPGRTAGPGSRSSAPGGANCQASSSTSSSRVSRRGPRSSGPSRRAPRRAAPSRRSPRPPRRTRDRA